MKTLEATAVRAPRGGQRSCKGWHQEAALRMLMNNLDPEVAERPQDLVVYGGTGKAARNSSHVAQAGTRSEFAMSTRGASGWVFATPTGFPDCTSSVSSASSRSSSRRITANASQLRAARPVPP